MRKLGYQPKLGLGKNEDGILDPVISKMKIGIGGLGFDSYNQMTLSRKNWTLEEHFIGHSKLLDPNERLIPSQSTLEERFIRLF